MGDMASGDKRKNLGYEVARRWAMADFLDLEDDAFIRSVYVAFYLREPHPYELYLEKSRLSNGVHRHTIVLALVLSLESRRLALKVRGITLRLLVIARYYLPRIRGKPFVSPLFIAATVYQRDFQSSGALRRMIRVPYADLSLAISLLFLILKLPARRRLLSLPSTNSHQCGTLAFPDTAKASHLSAALFDNAIPIQTWPDFAAVISTDSKKIPLLQRVLVFAQETAEQPINTGIQRVVRQLSAALQEIGLEIIPVGWNAAERSLRLLGPSERASLARFSGPHFRNWDKFPENVDSTWLIIPEILCPPAPEPGVVIQWARDRGIRTACIVHDIAIMKMPDIYPRIRREAFQHYLHGITEADAVLAVSRAVARDIDVYIRRALPHLLNKKLSIQTCPNGENFPGTERVTKLVPTNARPRHFLYVATIEPRKNHLRLLAAVRQVQTLPGYEDLRLTLVGSTRPYPDFAMKVRNEAIQIPQCVLVDDADDESLAEMYAVVDATVYASFEEGFGLPIVESLWHGKPCLCHNDHAIREIAEPGGCLMVDMRDPQAIADGIVRLCGEQGLAIRLANDAVVRRLKPWTDSAQHMVRVLLSSQATRAPSSFV